MTVSCDLNLWMGALPLAAALLMSLAAPGAAQPRPPQTDAPAAPAFEKLGTFIGPGGKMSTLVAPGPNGSERLYIAYNYASSMDIVGYEADGRYKVWSNPEGGAWAMETGPDGKLYIGTYYNGHLLRLDPQTDKMDDLGQAVAGETYIWQLSLGPDGFLYGATYPGAKLIRFDPRTNQVTDLGKMDAQDKYCRSVFAARDGWVYCGTGSVKANLVAYHAQTKEVRSLIPENERKAGFGTILRGADGYAYATYFGKNFSLRDGAATPIEKLPAIRPTNRRKDGELFAMPPTYPGRSLPLFRVGAGPDGKIYASGVLPEYLLRYDPATGERTTLGLIPGAEAYSLLAAHNKLYIASYTGATLQTYDPAKPFNPGPKRDNNPSYYGSTAPQQNRPYDMVLGDDGKVYIANVPGYGIYGGALAWHDPATDSVEHIATPIADQSIVSLCDLPGPLLLVGTSIEAGSGAPSRAKEAVLFAWDTTKKEVAWQQVPIPGAASISNLTRGGDGLIYASTEKEVFAFDAAMRTVVGRTTLPQGTVVRAGLHTLDDGRVVALAGASALLIAFNGGRWTTMEFARAQASISVGKAAVGGYFYAALDNQLLRARIPAPAK